MKLVILRRPLHLILRWTRRGLFASAIAMLAYCGFLLMDSGIFQHRERRHLEQLRHDSLAARNPKPAVMDGLIGRIEIPRLGLSTIVMEGTNGATLRRAVGHIAGTALPGQAGNVGIAGHRDTFFRPLRNIRPRDVITLTTLLGEYRYRVISARIVTPTDVGVLAPSQNEVLTLVTCYPFYFVGSAPDRFIVRAERVGNTL